MKLRKRFGCIMLKICIISWHPGIKLLFKLMKSNKPRLSSRFDFTQPILFNGIKSLSLNSWKSSHFPMGSCTRLIGEPLALGHKPVLLRCKLLLSRLVMSKTLLLWNFVVRLKQKRFCSTSSSFTLTAKSWSHSVVLTFNKFYWLHFIS